MHLPMETVVACAVMEVGGADNSANECPWVEFFETECLSRSNPQGSLFSMHQRRLEAYHGRGGAWL